MGGLDDLDGVALADVIAEAAEGRGAEAELGDAAVGLADGRQSGVVHDVLRSFSS
jgi:hypothetical protein